MFQLGQGAALRRIAGDQFLGDGEVQGGRDHLVEIPHRFGTEAFGLMFGLQPFYSAGGQQFLVELLQIQRGELVQREITDVGLDVVVDVPPVGLMGGGADLDFGVVLKPDVQPLSHGILAGPDQVQAGGLLDGPLQLFLCLSLGFGQDIFVDGFAGFRVMAGGIPALPPSVFPLADVSLAVGSSFCHVQQLLSDTTHITEGGRRGVHTDNNVGRGCYCESRSPCKKTDFCCSNANILTQICCR